MEQYYYLIVKCTPLSDDWETDAAREPVCITTDTDPYDCEGYEIYHIDPDNGALILVKDYNQGEFS